MAVSQTAVLRNSGDASTFDSDVAIPTMWSAHGDALPSYRNAKETTQNMPHHFIEAGGSIESRHKKALRVLKTHRVSNDAGITSVVNVHFF